MEVRAKLSDLQSTARKVRLIANLIRGKSVATAIDMLNFTSKKAARPMVKLLHSAVANAVETGEMDVDRLIVKTVMVDEGRTMKRFMPRAMGRATKINKRTSHITVVLSEE